MPTYPVPWTVFRAGAIDVIMRAGHIQYMLLNVSFFNKGQSPTTDWGDPKLPICCEYVAVTHQRG